MIHEINTLKDVVMFIKQVAGEIDNFHPLEDFANYVYPDSYCRRYTDEDAENRNRALEKCISISARHKPDPFTYLYNLFLKETAVASLT